MSEDVTAMSDAGAPAQPTVPDYVQDLYELCRRSRDRYVARAMAAEAGLFQARMEGLRREYPGLHE